jgi:hypothetical protein
VKKTLWRAAEDDYVRQGTSFAPKRSVAEAYLDNPGFGGEALFKAVVDLTNAPVLDMTGWKWRDVQMKLGVPTPHGIGIDEWLPQDPHMLDAIRARGYLWAKVDESYPRGEVTWIWCGHSWEDDEPELVKVKLR